MGAAKARLQGRQARTTAAKIMRMQATPLMYPGPAQPGSACERLFFRPTADQSTTISLHHAQRGNVLENGLIVVEGTGKALIWNRSLDGR